MPTIVLLNIRGYQHFAVLRAIDRHDRVYLADPALGNRVITFKEFKESWNGILLAVIGAGYRPDAPLPTPLPRSLSEARMGSSPRSMKHPCWNSVFSTKS